MANKSTTPGQGQIKGKALELHKARGALARQSPVPGQEQARPGRVLKFHKARRAVAI